MHSRCCVCGKPIRNKGRDTPIYCEEHRDHALRDRAILQSLTLEDTFRIIYAALIRARDDYVLNADNKRKDAARFFRSNWAQILTNGELDPDAVFKELDRYVYEFEELGTNPERAQQQ